MSDYAVVDGELFQENVVCPKCQHVQEVTANEQNFLIIDGKTSDQWDELVCPVCASKLHVGVVGLTLVNTKILPEE